METFFVVTLVFLALLAVFDIFVGVSNDAVNFLNSAIGSRVARFRTVVLVAGVGVVVGCTFSSGMMEIARNGVFNPQMFTFSEIMVIFFAVMVTDVLLLNVFNLLGLPTSTTVSLIFEMLGGAVAAAGMKLWRQGDALHTLGGYLNNEKALAIVSGILVSVAVAFTAGVLVQYLVRLAFTFRYERAYRRLGGLFGSLALTSIFYFLVMKGARGTSFLDDAQVDWLEANVGPVLAVSFLFLAALFQALILWRGVNVFKIVILAGTFALAFAFAGNDLVNFVGVPLAAYDGYRAFAASGAAPDAFTMESLTGAVATPTPYLLVSGLVMALTLWFSKKAHHVVQTSIKLASAARGEKEQFGSSRAGRVLVRFGLEAGKFLRRTIPAPVWSFLDRRMAPPPPPAPGETVLPFDQVRAAVNLVVASILIASATSLKLPLSTTYVTFMVGMGSSFADGAWDRETAVYRISGVLMVIGGWFFTAVAAFTACAALTAAVIAGGMPAAVILMVATSAILIHTNFIAKTRGERTAATRLPSDRAAIRRRIDAAMGSALAETVELFGAGLAALFSEDGAGLKRARTRAATLSDEISRKRGEYYRMALEGGDDADDDARHFYYRAFTNMKEVGHGLRVVLRQAEEHVANRHRVFEGTLREHLERTLRLLETTRRMLGHYVHQKGIGEAELSDFSNDCLQELTRLQFEFLRRLDEHRLSLGSSDLYLGLLQFAREFVSRYTIVALLQRDFEERPAVAPATAAADKDFTGFDEAAGGDLPDAAAGPAGV